MQSHTINMCIVEYMYICNCMFNICNVFSYVSMLPERNAYTNLPHLHTPSPQTKMSVIFARARRVP